MHKHSLCCWPVSVHPSATFVYCIQMAEDIIKLLSRPGSHMILVFFIPNCGTQFQGEFLQQGTKCQGGKNLRFLD